ncbi:HD-GYP domain-containing protein [Candidatus Solirubrobacter pratensis]|uniref:HD-GYP domain-containing protein n=1 Tax=Candidatus Solirubrobacter pratensis TaxID=1298857 RepID=UPI00041D3D6F|nr:HD-GYP domain-containing protein [Candidatus Solirubrobacter pratensis]
MVRTRIVLALAVLVPAVVVAVAGSHVVMMSKDLHFGLVAGAAALTSFASLGLTVSGARARDGRAVLMGTAFSTMTALFAVHGMSTPGVLVGDNGVIALAGGLSIPVGAYLLALTALPPLRRTRNVEPLLALQAGLFAGVLGLGALALIDSSIVPAVPQPKSAPAIGLLAAGAATLLLLVVRALRTYTLTHRWTDLAVAAGCAWLAIALYANLVIGSMTLAFFIGHFLEIAAVALVGIPAALDIRRAGASRPLVGDLSAAELVESEAAYLGPRVHALMARLAARDESTGDHTRRVALLAARVGDDLKLSATARRHLAVGGLLHDIGKLSVPLEILQKPAALADEEFAAIKRHPGDGRKLLDELGGFPAEICRLVSDHHERLDGSGYPRGLKAPELNLQTRILAVCDVYDALVSDRVYRPAWTPERALALLHQESHAYDPGVVAALQRAVAPERGSAEPGWVADLSARAADAARGAGPRPAAAS